MAKKKKITAILISIGIACAAIFSGLVILPQFWISYGCKSSCASVESDAQNIAAAIADYFAIPEHTHIKPGDIELPTENPWTLIQCDDAIYIYVYDIEEDCPMDYQNSYPKWNSSIYTKIID